MDEIIKALTNCQEEIHNKIKSAEAQIERIKGTRLEQDILDSLRYFRAVSARLAVCIDVLGGRDFILYQEGQDLILVKPDEGTAKLLKKAEELGARLVEYNLKAEQQQALM